MKAYTKFKKALLNRHPPVCSNCQPKVNSSIFNLNTKLQSIMLQNMTRNSIGIVNDLRPINRFNIAHFTFWLLAQLGLAITFISTLTLHGMGILYPLTWRFSDCDINDAPHMLGFGRCQIFSLLVIYNFCTLICIPFHPLQQLRHIFTQCVFSTFNSNLFYALHLKLYLHRLFALYISIQPWDPLISSFIQTLLFVNAILLWIKAYRTINFIKRIHFKPSNNPPEELKENDEISELFSASKLHDVSMYSWNWNLVSMALLSPAPFISYSSVSLGLVLSSIICFSMIENDHCYRDQTILVILAVIYSLFLANIVEKSELWLLLGLLPVFYGKCLCISLMLLLQGKCFVYQE